MTTYTYTLQALLIVIIVFCILVGVIGGLAFKLMERPAGVSALRFIITLAIIIVLIVLTGIFMAWFSAWMSTPA